MDGNDERGSLRRMHAVPQVRPVALLRVGTRAQALYFGSTPENQAPSEAAPAQSPDDGKSAAMNTILERLNNWGLMAGEKPAKPVERLVDEKDAHQPLPFLWNAKLKVWTPSERGSLYFFRAVRVRDRHGAGAESCGRPSATAPAGHRRGAESAERLAGRRAQRKDGAAHARLAHAHQAPPDRLPALDDHCRLRLCVNGHMVQGPVLEPGHARDDGGHALDHQGAPLRTKLEHGVPVRTLHADGSSHDFLESVDAAVAQQVGTAATSGCWTGVARARRGKRIAQVVFNALFTVDLWCACPSCRRAGMRHNAARVKRPLRAQLLAGTERVRLLVR